MEGLDVTKEINLYLQSFASLIEACSIKSRGDFKPHLTICEGVIDFVEDNRAVFSIIYSHLQYIKLDSKKISELKIPEDEKIEMYKIYSNEKNLFGGIEKLLIKEEINENDVPWIREAGKVIEYLTPKNINYLDCIFFDSAYDISINELKEKFPSLKKEGFLERYML